MRKENEEGGGRKGAYGGKSHLYRAVAPPHLHWVLCTVSIPGTNEGYELVQMSGFPVVEGCLSPSPPPPQNFFHPKCTHPQSVPTP
jgi:hypothetical protein